jgi:hypothetical protein
MRHKQKKRTIIVTMSGGIFQSRSQREYHEEYDQEEQTYEAYPAEEEQYEYQADEDQDHDQDRYEEEVVDEDDQGIYE